MQDNLPDLPSLPAINPARPAPKQKLPNLLTDDKRLAKAILLGGFGVLLLLGIVVSVLERVAPRAGRPGPTDNAAITGLWSIEPQPNQIVFGFFEDENLNGQFDYREQPFDGVSVAIRRAGETEPFRRVAAGNDGLVKIDDLSQGEYEVSFDNYFRPEPAADWLWFEEYQRGSEFLPTAWQKLTLSGRGYKELVGVNAYRPPLLLALATEAGISWYDPQRAREAAKSNFNLTKITARGEAIYYLLQGKLHRLNWFDRAATEELIWLEEAESGRWWLSPLGRTIAYTTDSGQFQWHSRDATCQEGSWLFEGVRPEVKTVSYIDEISWLVVARTERDRPWELFQVNCGQGKPVSLTAEPVNAGSLAGGDWFYSTAEATYFYDKNQQRAVKYTALGGGDSVLVSADGRYLLKKLAGSSWLVVDYPAVKSAGVEKHYLLTGVSGEPVIIGDSVYYVRAKTCEADGDCGEVVKINLEGSGVWSVAAAWDLKNVAATKVLSVIIRDS